VWRLKWQPEFAIQLIEAGQWGNTIGAASSARVCHAADQAPDLVTLTGLVEDVLLAELPEAIQHVMSSLQAQAAVSSDTNHLMQALPPLVNVLRYGNVRQTDTEMIARVVDGLVVRICIGLLGACSALDDDAAGDMFTRIVAVDEAISRTANDDHRQQWERALAALAGRTNLPGILTGRACRILMDRGILSIDESARRLGLALSTASDPLQAAAWVEGFLRGSGQFLVHDDALLAIIDGWLAALPVDTFNHLLPLLRRTFATFSRPERRAIGERVRGQTRQKAVSDDSVDFDLARADAVLPLVRMLLGSDDRGE
jgi:hypothetical protein